MLHPFQLERSLKFNTSIWMRTYWRGRTDCTEHLLQRICWTDVIQDEGAFHFMSLWTQTGRLSAQNVTKTRWINWFMVIFAEIFSLRVNLWPQLYTEQIWIHRLNVWLSHHGGSWLSNRWPWHLIWQHAPVISSHYRRIGLCKGDECKANDIRWVYEQWLLCSNKHKSVNNNQKKETKRQRNARRTILPTSSQRKHKNAEAGATQTIPRRPTVLCVRAATLINICLSTYHLSYSSAGRWGGGSATARWAKQNAAD